MQVCSIVDVVERGQLAREATEPSDFYDTGERLCRLKSPDISHEEKRNIITQAEKLLVNANLFLLIRFIIFRLQGGETPRWFPVLCLIGR